MTCTPSTFTTATDGTEHYFKCDECNEAHYFRSEYFAKQWANRHGQVIARTFCTCTNH